MLFLSVNHYLQKRILTAILKSFYHSLVYINLWTTCKICFSHQTWLLGVSSYWKASTIKYLIYPEKIKITSSKTSNVHSYIRVYHFYPKYTHRQAWENSVDPNHNATSDHCLPLIIFSPNIRTERLAANSVTPDAGSDHFCKPSSFFGRNMG